MYNRQNNEFIEDDEGEEAAAKKTVFNNARHMENFPCIARHALGEVHNEKKCLETCSGKKLQQPKEKVPCYKLKKIL